MLLQRRFDADQAAGALAALGVGALALRTRGFFFLMVTLAFGQMLFFVFHDTPLGGGADGVNVATLRHALPFGPQFAA